ncbi:hypothetical protein SEUCBS139899_000182 [Sporothrix eucalyptigena]
MVSTAPSPLPTSSQQLREKEQLFTNWGLNDDSQTLVGSIAGSSPAEQKTTDLSPIEREHRRKSKAFADAARAEVEKKAAQEKAAEERVRAVEKEDDENENDNDDVVEIIDLTLPRPLPPPHPPRRTVSATIESVKASATLRRSNSTPLPETSTTGQKRKRVEEVSKDKMAKTKQAKGKARDITPPLVPEQQRIFAGLAFYYLPDAALGARRLRIAKARQHGAQWVRSLREATHVVVDKQLRWSEVSAVVRDEGGDETRPIVVNEEYPLDCIGFRCLLNPEQRRQTAAGASWERWAGY